MRKPKIFGIIGAGPSGVLAGLLLDKKKYDYEILEASDSIGGHAGSFFDQGYTFDYGPHIMFSKDQKILDFMVDSLGDNVERCKRNNVISYKGRIVRYPFENDLSALPLKDNYECLTGFLFNRYKTIYRQPKNLRQWLLKTFGKGICEKYLFPYNEKVWNIPVKDLSMLWAQRIPRPPVEDVIKSSIGYKTEGYLHQLYYYYPKKGGYQAITEAWAKNQKSKITTGARVTKITKLANGQFKVIDNHDKHYLYDRLISTMPIHQLLQIYNGYIPQNIKQAVNSLIVNPMYIISLGVKGIDNNKYTAIYFPEKEFLVNRLSFPTTFSSNNAPRGHFSVQAEITCAKNSEIWRYSDSKIIQHVVDGLVKRKLLEKSHLKYTNLKRALYSYVVYDAKYEKNVKLVRKWFPEQGIDLLGRFSYFEYINVDGVIKTAQKIINNINKKPTNI